MPKSTPLGIPTESPTAVLCHFLPILCPFFSIRKYTSANYDLDHRDPDDGASDQEVEAGEVSTTNSEKHEDKGTTGQGPIANRDRLRITAGEALNIAAQMNAV